MGVGWKDIVRLVAPALATALGGQAAGIAVRQMGDRLLGKPDATEAEVEALVLTATPEQLKALRELDNEFAKQMADLGVKLEEIEAADRADARAREKALPSDWTPRVLAGLGVGLFITVMLILMLRREELPASTRDVLSICLGILAGVVQQVFGYYFGSSSSSKVKDAVIGRVAEAKK